MNMVEETRRKVREDLFGKEWAALMGMQDDDEDGIDDIPCTDPEEEF